MSPKITRLDYCQFLLSSQINYTLTYFADHVDEWSHDMINRYLRGERIPPRLVWDNVQPDIVFSEQGYIVFDDTVVDKRYSSQIELVRRQYSGNAKRVIKGIGVVTCVYVNPEIDRFWMIDYRIYHPDGDGKSKLQHVQDMLRNIVYQKHVPFSAVLMDTWYAAKWLMLYIEKLEKVYYCPIKANRQTNESGEKGDYHRVDSLTWTPEEHAHGKRVHLKGFPKGHQLKLFRLLLSTKRTDYVVTNDLAQDSVEAVQEASGFRWKIEEFHRETKQVTGIENCQCRIERIQRNHIGCAVLVWVRLKQLAYQTGQTLYQIKHNLLDEYMVQQLKNPTVQMALA
jgi:hypothetical protein